MLFLKAHYAMKPEIKPLLKPLSSSNDESAESLIREVIDKNPDRKIQALACRSLATGREGIDQVVERIKTDAELRKNFQSVRGKPYVDKLIADHDKSQKETEELKGFTNVRRRLPPLALSLRRALQEYGAIL